MITKTVTATSSAVTSLSIQSCTGLAVAAVTAPWMWGSGLMMMWFIKWWVSCSSFNHYLLLVTRSHAPAWECIQRCLRDTAVWVPTEDRGNQSYNVQN